MTQKTKKQGKTFGGESGGKITGSKKWYWENHERAKEANRRQRAWERFELRRYRELKEKVRQLPSHSFSARELIRTFDLDEAKFKQWYAEKYGK